MSVDIYRRQLDEADKLFSKYSAYYKSVDNNDISFLTWRAGTGGDFLQVLFSDNYDNIFDFYATTARCLKDYQEKNKFFPCFDIDFDNGVYDIDGRTKKGIARVNPRFKFRYIDELNFSKDTIKEFDYEFYQICLSTVGKKWAAQRLPILPYFYYRNFEKVTIVMIDADQSLDEYINKLAYIKIGMLPKENTEYFNFLPSGNLVKIDYKQLFFEQDDRVIEKLMNLFNSKQALRYYKAIIKQYHERNLKVITTFPKEIIKDKY